MTFAGANNVIISGDKGADRITTAGGADTIFGGDGADVITTGAGVDAGSKMMQKVWKSNSQLHAFLKWLFTTLHFSICKMMLYNKKL